MLELVEQMTASMQQRTQAAEVAQIASEAADFGGNNGSNSRKHLCAARNRSWDFKKNDGEASQQISNIGNLINEIALQTLANASIEAARSGRKIDLL